ncbi:MAG: bacillithiol biosynthesis cysteine-adding enzyme BshC [Bacteroidetes bacterium]|nr:bacillithiol biosynthesis cysteine-adding enzyme BshC [Bacteroidota bacterium]
MEIHCSYIHYEQTGYFSKLAIDYINGADQLKEFYNLPPTIEGLQQSIEQRKGFRFRNVLVEQLRDQYKDIEVTPKIFENIAALGEENTFTVTTAHQPNIFSGPLYVIYKIFHAIKLAETLKTKWPENKFVPVYFMGSEDADLDELNNISIDQRKYVWQTKQTGAVGRMKVDKSLLQLMNEMEGQLSVTPFGKELMDIFRYSYQEKDLIQQSTLKLLNSVFGKYGLIVLIADKPAFKKVFQPVLERELKEQFSHKALEKTIEKLSENYKAQAAGRNINLFYLKDDKRERIELDDDKFKVEHLELEWTENDIIKELDEHPERFSPNVILRGVFQETILPNIAFIGGGGELAYWMELKGVFNQAGIPYPVLLLRNSFLIIDKKQNGIIEKTGLQYEDLFLSEHAIMKKIVATKTNNAFALNDKLENFETLYDALEQQAIQIDASLRAHVESLKTKAIKKLKELEKKMLRSEKKKFATDQSQLQKLKSKLFPNGSLQERVENFSGFYSMLGNQFLDDIFLHSKGLDQTFAILSYT